jgi:hypothetical protein
MNGKFTNGRWEPFRSILEILFIKANMLGIKKKLFSPLPIQFG